MAGGKTLKTTITLYGKQDASLKRAFQAAQGSGAQAAAKLSGVFTKAAAVASAAFAAIKVGDFMKDAMETYATFEQSMANTAAIAGASAEEYEGMRAKLRPLKRLRPLMPSDIWHWQAGMLRPPQRLLCPS